MKKNFYWLSEMIAFGGMRTKEIWRPIPSHAEYYEASSLGRIRSIKTKKILSQHKNESGYWYVRLSSGIRKMYRVHRLIALAFYRPKKNCNHVNHKNWKRGDNRAVNLEWISHENNIIHKYARKSFRTRRQKIAIVRKWIKYGYISKEDF